MSSFHVGIERVPLYTEVSSFQVGIEGVHCIWVFLFQSVRIEGFHYIQRCPHFMMEYKGVHCIQVFYSMNSGSTGLKIASWYNVYRNYFMQAFLE